jgi:non-haem dioxygenase in morphine synthesis N-terminal
VIDLENVQLEAVRAGSQELGAVQVVNHGVPGELSADLERRMARLLSLPRAEKARLASPHPYRGWAAVAGRLRAAGARAIQRGPVRQRRGGERGGSQREVSRAVLLLEHADDSAVTILAENSADR